MTIAGGDRLFSPMGRLHRRPRREALLAGRHVGRSESRNFYARRQIMAHGDMRDRRGVHYKSQRRRRMALQALTERSRADGQ